MICTKAILIGFLLPLSNVDKLVLQRADRVCIGAYKACVKKVERIETNRYHVTCGNKKGVVIWAN